MEAPNERTKCVSGTEWPPAPAGPREWAQRILAFLALALAGTGFFIPSPGGALGFVLAGFVAALICAVMELLTKLPTEPTGQVRSRGRSPATVRHRWIDQPAEEGGQLGEPSTVDDDSFLQWIGVPSRARR